MLLHNGIILVSILSCARMLSQLGEITAMACKDLEPDEQVLGKEPKDIGRLLYEICFAVRSQLNANACPET